MKRSAPFDKSRKPMPDRSNWFEDFFHGVANDLWRKIADPEQTRAEADFLEKTLGRKTRLLDVPCGNGRHALELARRGCRVTGLDISQEFIGEARELAKARKLKAEFVQGDMRQLRWRSEFDGVFCVGNAFGYLEYSDMLRFVDGLARALAPGGRFVIETGMAAESILPTLKEREWYQVQDILFAIENRYLGDASCLETEATFVRNGRTERRTWWHWVYTAGEIRRLLERSGLKVRQMCSGHKGQPFKLGNPLLIVMGEKPGGRASCRSSRCPDTSRK
jgi:SAM-dependent methyltransferase